MFQEYFSVIAQGIPTSLGLTFVALAIAFVLAIFFTFLLSMENRWVKCGVNAYLTLFTGTPLLVQFFLLYHGPGQFQWLVESPLWVFFSDAWFCAVLALALNSAAYSTQLFHGAVKAIPKGQWEASYAIGMNYPQAFIRTIMPQALRISVPSLSNTFISTVKDTSLASLVWIAELFRVAQNITAENYEFILIYSEAALIYWVFCFVLAIGQTRLEKRLSRHL